MKRLFQLLALLGLAWAVLWTTTLRPKLSAAERGRRIAEKTGCFGCHGPEGIEGSSNPGSLSGKVPSFRALMMYAKDEQEVREWIRDGAPAARKKTETWRKNRDASAMRMPSFGKRLRSGQIDDLVAFVMAASGENAPEDSLEEAGFERARELGCTGCHGSGGQYSRPNPRSLKGYVASWDGGDFPDLVRNRREFDEWVERGVSARFDSNPAAKYFLRRAVLRMPAYERFLKAGDLDALWAYVSWLRSNPSGARSAESP